MLSRLGVDSGPLQHSLSDIAPTASVQSGGGGNMPREIAKLTTQAVHQHATLFEQISAAARARRAHDRQSLRSRELRADRNWRGFNADILGCRRTETLCHRNLAWHRQRPVRSLDRLKPCACWRRPPSTSGALPCTWSRNSTRCFVLGRRPGLRSLDCI